MNSGTNLEGCFSFLDLHCTEKQKKINPEEGWVINKQQGAAF
jgi:hypothetical protein